jgi:hypothetical protein
LLGKPGVNESSTAKHEQGMGAGGTIEKAAGFYLEGRVESAVDVLERAAREHPIDPGATRLSKAILETLDAIARTDPQFRRERRGLRMRLLILAGSVGGHAASSGDGDGARCG